MSTFHRIALTLLALLISTALGPTADAQRYYAQRVTLRIGNVKVMTARRFVIGTATTRRTGRTRYIPITLSGLSMVDGGGTGGDCGFEDPVCDGELTGSDPEDNPDAAGSVCFKLIKAKMSDVLAAAAAGEITDEVVIEAAAVEPADDCQTD
ncbi:MAG: hypothetical protein Rubg2KO_40370 [Rubricoccaceae bacterium]